MMNYDNALKKLDELVVELLDKGLSIPQHFFDEIKSARSMAKICRADPNKADAVMNGAPFLEIAEMNLLAIAEAGCGKEYADIWQRAIAEAYNQPDGGAKSAGFVSGVPKTDYWIRIDPSEINLGSDETAQLPAELNLSAKPQPDGYLLIHGAKENVMAYLREVRRTTKEGAE